MATWKSADESFTELKAAMGAELGELFHALSTELTWLHWRWKQYRILFGDKDSRIDIVNEAAPFFFRMVQDVFFEDTLLGIARLVGPPESAGKANLTITRLPPMIPSAPLRTKVEELIAKAKDSAAFAIDWRNRHLAHRDLDLALNASAAPLAPASRAAVEQALQALRDVLNHLDSTIRQTTTAYQMCPAIGDAEQALSVLRDGLLRERDRRLKWDKGELHEDDRSPPEAV